MYDANNNISNEIKVEFSGKNGKYTLIYKPSFEWLVSDLTYPVVIDPVINTSKENISIKDGVVDSSNPDGNYADSIILSTYKCDSEIVQSFIDLSTDYVVKNGTKIKSVLLGLYYEDGLFIDDSTTVAAYTVTSDWNEDDLTYNNKPTTINSLIERKEIKRGRNAGYILFDVTKAYTLNQDTYGICIRQRDSVNSKVQTKFSSSGTADTSQQPYFIVEYYESRGVEEQFDYHAFDVGRAGTAYFNDFTEQVYIERDELGLSGINMPVQIKRYFNSGLGGNYSLNNYLLSGFTSTYGYGWRTNYNQLIEYHNEIDEKETILYCNEAGQTTYFQKDENNSSTGVTTWEEVPDKFSTPEGYTLEIPSEYDDKVANNLQYVKIKDSSGKVYEFNSQGLLTKINSAQADFEKNITIYYDENDYKIKKIIDGVGREYRFTYTEYDEWLFPLLTSIQAYSPSGAEITVSNNGTEVPYKMTYTYVFLNYLGIDGVPVLESATYPDGETVYYTVDDNLISLNNIDGYAIEFAFNQSNTVISEKVYSENGTDVTNGGQLTIIDENSYEKSYIDLNGTKITKQFDMYGRTINTKINNDVTQSVPRTYSDDYNAQGSVSYSFYNTYEQNLTDNETNLVTNSSFTENLSGWTISDSDYVKRNSNSNYKKGNETPGYLQLKCEPNEMQYASQIIDIENGVSGDEYRLDYFVKNTTHSHMATELALIDTIIVEARENVEGTETWETVAWVEANPFNDNWQKYSYTFDMDIPYNQIRVIVAFYCQYGTVWYDDISLVNEYKATANQIDDAEIEEETCSCGCEDCYYGENCPCAGAINNDCQCPECLRKETSTQDNFGNTLSNKSTDGINYIETFNSYTADGNNLASYTDENGNVITYDYDLLNGILKSVTSPMGNGNETTTTNYSYDAMGKVVSVSTTVSDSENQALQYVYVKDRLTEIITPNGKYRIIYDDWGQVSSVNVVTGSGESENVIPLVEYTYNDGAKRTQVKTVTYKNSSENVTSYRYEYYDNGTLKKVFLNEEEIHYIEYDNNGVLTSIKNVGGRTVKYTDNGTFIYNPAGNCIYSTLTNDDGTVTEENYGVTYKTIAPESDYDSATGISTETEKIEINSNNRIAQETKSDYFGRTKSQNVSVYNITNETEETPATLVGKIQTEYGYSVEEDGKTSSTIEKYINKTYNGDSESYRVYDGYFYEYDKQNKISAEKTLNADGTTTDKYSYEYDKLGQLVRFNNAVENNTYTYTYDNNGNILTKSEYAYTTGDLGTATNTTTYGYDTQWKDKLTTVGDKTIVYDNIGNPTSYLGATLTWEGRQLKSYEDDEYIINYEYDENGMRYRTVGVDKTSEENTTTTIDYVWLDEKLVSMVVNDGDSTSLAAKYLYNDSDEVIGFKWVNDTDAQSTYYYLKNLQGDITGIVSSTGKLEISFNYDAWGKRTTDYHVDSSSPLAALELLNKLYISILNPFGYRGYCYDGYAGFYYLQSRYYDSNTGRFINADDTNYLNATGTVLGCNLFAYCENDAVNFVDESGYDKNSISGKKYNYKYTGSYKKNKTTYKLTFSIGDKEVAATYKNGIIKVDNSRDDVKKIFKTGRTKTFAYALRKLAREINENALKKRTVEGIAYELIAHYVWYKKGIRKSSSKVTDCGAKSGDVGYDYNAYIFEKDKSKFSKVEELVKKDELNSALVKSAPTLAKLGWQAITS